MEETISYGIIGDGRLARHFQYYLQHLGHPVSLWSRRLARKDKHSFADFLSPAEIILVLIKDGAIENFIREHPSLHGKILIHCSGALATDLAFGFHPLMTFTPKLYDYKMYPQIPFVVDSDAPDFQKIFPKFANPHFCIRKKDKPLYHAMCVLAGNGAAILWQRLFAVFQEIGLPHEIAVPYLKQMTENLGNDPRRALTGPLARKDQATIRKNLDALGESPLADMYRLLAQILEENNG